MIILEGPDGAGKTTLRDRILADWGGEFVAQPRAVSSDAVSIVPIGEYIEKELARGFGNRLYDRFALISSPMYLPLPNPTFVDPMTNVDWLRAQYQKMDTVDPAIIYCLPPLEEVRKNVLNDESSEVMWPYIDLIYHNYVAFIARHWSTSSMVYDYTNPDLLRLAGLLRWASARCKEGRQWKSPHQLS